MDIVTQFKQSAQKTIAALKEELKSIRTGRATPALVENLQITTYNGTTTLKLKEIASISTEGPQTLVIAPYDATTVGDIEKGILSSAMGLTPASQGTRILVKIPPLSQEQKITKFAPCSLLLLHFPIDARKCYSFYWNCPPHSLLFL